MATWKMMVATEGSTATFEFADSTYSDSDPVVGNGTMNRVAKTKRPAAGSHAISGSWQISKMESVTNNALMFTLRLEDDSLSMTNPTGQSYTAKLDGTDAPYKGDPGINSVSVMRLSKDTFVETDKRDGKAVRTRRLMVNPGDAKTMSIIVDDSFKGTTVLVAEKQ